MACQSDLFVPIRIFLKSKKALKSTGTGRTGRLYNTLPTVVLKFINNSEWLVSNILADFHTKSVYIIAIYV